MNSITPVLAMSDTYMSETTHFFHLLVQDVSSLSMYILEFLSALIIVTTTVVAFWKLVTQKPYARVYLLHGQSVGLTFKLGAEILRTIVAVSLMDIFEIFLLIIIKAGMIWLIEWELESIEDPSSSNGFNNHRDLSNPMLSYKTLQNVTKERKRKKLERKSHIDGQPSVEELQRQIDQLNSQVHSIEQEAHPQSEQ